MMTPDGISEDYCNLLQWARIRKTTADDEEAIRMALTRLASRETPCFCGDCYEADIRFEEQKRDIGRKEKEERANWLREQEEESDELINVTSFWGPKEPIMHASGVAFLGRAHLLIPKKFIHKLRQSRRSDGLFVEGIDAVAAIGLVKRKLSGSVRVDMPAYRAGNHLWYDAVVLTLEGRREVADKVQALIDPIESY